MERGPSRPSSSVADALALKHASYAYVIENGRIVDVSAQALPVDDARRIDAGGRVALPGLIDAHVHVVASSHDLAALSMQPMCSIAARN